VDAHVHLVLSTDDAQQCQAHLAFTPIRPAPRFVHLRTGWRYGVAVAAAGIAGITRISAGFS
jgi:hypothetical protein